MSWGLVARCDIGGLGNLSREIAAHLRPDKILFVIMPGASGRGDCNRAGFEPIPGPEDAIGRIEQGLGLPAGIVRGEAEVFAAPLPAEFVAGYHQEGTLDIAACQAFLEGLDICLGLETWYDPRFPGWAKRAGCRTALYAMRELLGGGGRYDCDLLLLPEPCEPESGLSAPLRPFQILPWPASPSRARIRPRPGAAEDGRLIWLHQAGAAMEDRNGTLALREALAYCAEPHHVLSFDGPPGVIGTDLIESRRGATSRWSHIGSTPAFWPELYLRGDCLILPRRYGFLSLPPIEAAALGVPSIMTALPPQIDWPLAALIGVGSPRQIRMKGGLANVWQPNAQQLAHALDSFAREPQLLTTASFAAQEWAEERSWEKLGPLWEAVLGIGGSA